MWYLTNITLCTTCESVHGEYPLLQGLKWADRVDTDSTRRAACSYIRLSTRLVCNFRASGPWSWKYGPKMPLFGYNVDFLATEGLILISSNESSDFKVLNGEEHFRIYCTLSPMTQWMTKNENFEISKICVKWTRGIKTRV